MGNDNINAIVNEIEINIIESMIEGSDYERLDEILDKTVSYHKPNYKNAVEDLTLIRKALYQNLVIYAEEVDEIINLGEYNKKTKQVNELLTNISLINKTINYIESYTNKLAIKHGLQEKEEAKISIDYLTKPKRMIINPRVLNELDSIPKEELHEFIKPFSVIINGGGIYNVDVKHYSKGNNIKLAGVEAYRGYQARIYTYPIASDIIYVFKVVQKKGDFPSAVKNAIAKGKPTESELKQMKTELEDKKQTEKDFSEEGKYTKLIQEFGEKIGYNQIEENDEIYIPRINDRIDNEAIIEDGLYIVNKILDTSYTIQKLKEEQSETECNRFKRLKDYIYNLGNSVLYSDTNNEDFTIEKLVEILNKLITIEEIIIKQTNDFYLGINEPSEEAKTIMEMSISDTITIETFEKENETKQLSQKRGILRKNIRQVKNRLLYYLNVLEKENSVLRKIERDVKIRGNIK